MEVAKFFGFNRNEQTQIVKDWKQLVKDILNDPEFSAVRDSEPNLFWFFYLNDNLVGFPPKLKELMEMALSLAVSSSDAERSFSLMNRYKPKERNRMGTELMNTLMFFKMNCARSVWEFPALDFSKKWEAAGHYLVDDVDAPIRKRRRKDPLEDEDDEHNLRVGFSVLSGRSAKF